MTQKTEKSSASAVRNKKIKEQIQKLNCLCSSVFVKVGKQHKNKKVFFGSQPLSKEKSYDVLGSLRAYGKTELEGIIVDAINKKNSFGDDGKNTSKENIIKTINHLIYGFARNLHNEREHLLEIRDMFSDSSYKFDRIYLPLPIRQESSISEEKQQMIVHTPRTNRVVKKILEELGLIHSFAGVGKSDDTDTEADYDTYVTQIAPTRKLETIISDLKNKWLFICTNKEGQAPAAGGGDALPPYMDTDRNIKELQRIESKGSNKSKQESYRDLSSTIKSISFDIKDIEKYEDDYENMRIQLSSSIEENKLNIDISEFKNLNRSVLSKNNEEHRRFYTNIQQVPSSIRKHMMINNEKVVEVDVRAMHPSICFALNKIEMKKWLKERNIENFYKLDGYGDDLSVSMCKELFMRFLNTESRSICLNTLLSYIRTNKEGQAPAARGDDALPPYMDTDRNIKELQHCRAAPQGLVQNDWKECESVPFGIKPKQKKQVQLWAEKNGGEGAFISLYKAFEERCKPIMNHLYQGKGKDIMNQESEFTKLVIDSFEGKPLIPIHDSFIVQAKDEALLKSCMLKSFRKVFGVASPELKIIKASQDAPGCAETTKTEPTPIPTLSQNSSPIFIPKQKGVWTPPQNETLKTNLSVQARIQNKIKEQQKNKS